MSRVDGWSTLGMYAVFHTGGGSPGISHLYTQESPSTQVSPSKLYYLSHILCITFPPKVASGAPPSDFKIYGLSLIHI